MFGEMHIINPARFLQELQAMECGKNIFAQISSEDFEVKQFETNPVEGYTAPENFPNCCPSHQDLVKQAQEFQAKFPDCCEKHKKLKSQKWFNKTEYNYLPEKVLSTTSYTWHCVGKHIDEDDWFKKICDYIDYTVKSYGQFPFDFGSPLGIGLYISTIEYKISNEKEIPQYKKEKLLEYIYNLKNPPDPVEQTDLNLLVGKYKEWIKIFPFEIGFFSHLKPHFEKVLPILSGAGDKNIYTGLTAFKIKKKEELIKFLNDTTLTILTTLNTKALFESNLLDNREKVELDIVVAKAKIKLEELKSDNWKDRKKYIKLLKKWLKGERNFIERLKEVLGDNKKSNFLASILDGMKKLQQNDTNEECIRNVRNDGPNKESGFRYWFKNYLGARFPEAFVTAEEEKGNGRIDLKMTQNGLSDKIIEFKGWWNSDKKVIVQQICSYLTDFEDVGYIFMINQNKNKNITEDYKTIIADKSLSYMDKSWRTHTLPDSSFEYYESKHTINIRQKTVFHFIFNAYF